MIRKNKNFLPDERFGALKDKKDKRDFRLSSIQKDASLPTYFCLGDDFKSKDQHSRGSCTSQAQAHHKERQEDIPIGARPIMAWTKELEGNTNYGAYTRNTFKVVKKIGCCKEKVCPEPSPSMSWEEYIDTKNLPNDCKEKAKEHRSKSYWRVDKDINKVKQAIYKNKNSVVISMAWFREFNNPKQDGTLPDYDKKGNYGGHAVEIKGWDDKKDSFIVKNSWGEGWGKNGDFLLPYDFFDDVVWDLWTSLDIPENLPVDERYGQERKWYYYNLEKAMAFNPWLRMKIKRPPNNREIKGLVYGRHPYENVFEGAIDDKWLYLTYPEYLKKQEKIK